MDRLSKIFIILAVLAIAAFSCKDDKGKEVVTGVNFDELENVTLKVGETKTVKAKVTPASYNASIDEFSITSSKTEFATVSGSAKGSEITVNVTGVAAGQTDIVITHLKTNQSKSKKVTVEEAALTGIAVTTPPTKMTYIAGENFDPAGMVVTASYAAGAPKTISHAELTYEYDFKTAGAKTVKVKYRDKSADITGITVNAATLVSIAVTTQPTKKTYWEGDVFDTAGMVVTATYSDNSKAPVTVTAEMLTYDFATAGAKTVTITYMTKTAEVTGITVNEVTLVSIAITGTLTTKTYEFGATFDPAGLTVTATYSNGKTEEIPLTDANLQFVYDFESAGDNKTITVKFTFRGATKEAKIEGNTGITVKEALPTGIAITGTATQTYYGIGEPFNPAGLVVTATYAKGDPKTIPNAEVEWIFDASTASAGTNTKDKSVTAKYKEKTASINNAFTVRTLAWRVEAAPTNGDEVIIKLYSNETTTAAISITGNRNITLEGVGNVREIIIHQQNNSLFNVTNGKLTLGKNVTLVGRGNSTSSLVAINTNGHFTMKEGSILTGNTASWSVGGGVNIETATSAFVMEGGAIIGNRCTNSGFSSGGVLNSGNGTFTMSGGSITGNSASIGGNDVYMYSYNSSPTISLSGDAKIGNLMLYAYMSYNVYYRASVTITSTFTGKVDKLDLEGAGTSGASYWLGASVIAKGSGASDAQLLSALDKFTLGDFINSSGTRSPISTGYHLYGVEEDENVSADFGKLVRTVTPCSPTISNRTLTFSNITPSGFTVSWNKATGLEPEKLRYTVFILEPVWQDGRLVWNYNTCNIGGTVDISAYNVVIPAHIETKGVYCYVRVESIDNSRCFAYYDGENVTFR